jgi:hypothetical protein
MSLTVTMRGNLEKIGVWLEYSLRKSLNHLAQEMEVSKGTMTLLGNYYTIALLNHAVHILHPCHTVVRNNFCNW